MERFAIKIDKPLKSKLKNLCRLCGIDNPNQIDILNNSELIVIGDDDEVSLCRKIFDCVGIQVMRTDKMSQRICTLCFDKICDFYEYRQMCMTTNLQTRKFLNLPPEQPKKQLKNVTFDMAGGESILGIDGEDMKVKIEPAPKTTKKTKKTPNVPSPDDESSYGALTQQDIELALKVEMEEKKKTTKKAKGSKASKPAYPLLAPKELNQRELERETQGKKLDKKRKSDKVTKAKPTKKVKKEPGIGCQICDQHFDTQILLNDHIGVMHTPTIASFGCASCHEQFQTAKDSTAHHDWHRNFKISYKCSSCNASFDKIVTFQRHVSACAKLLNQMGPIVNDIQCDICNLKFQTQNLFDWHGCFIQKNKPCPRCQRVYTKRSILFKHIFKCTAPKPVPESIILLKPKPASKAKAKKRTATTVAPVQFKSEPEAIIESNADDIDINDDYDHFIGEQNKAQRPSRKRKTSSTVTSTNLGNLPQCSIKLEPIDLSQFMISLPNDQDSMETEDADDNDPSPDEPFENDSLPDGAADEDSLPDETVDNDPPPVQPQLTVPRLTIRIKKEVLHPGYGDVFDPEMARNIKQEKNDESWELVNNTTNEQILIRNVETVQEPEIEKPKEKTNKPKKLYKKPALLAIKIKQERMERELEDNYNGGYEDFSMPQTNSEENISAQPFENPLPIITQIHSLLDPNSIISNQPDELPTMLPNPFSMSLSSANHTMTSSTIEMPFKPIRIKRERMSPPLENSDMNEQVPDSTSMENSNAFSELKLSNVESNNAQLSNTSADSPHQTNEPMTPPQDGECEEAIPENTEVTDGNEQSDAQKDKHESEQCLKPNEPMDVDEVIDAPSEQAIPTEELEGRAEREKEMTLNNDMLATEGIQDSQVDVPAMEQTTIEEGVNENNDLPSDGMQQDTFGEAPSEQAIPTEELEDRSEHVEEKTFNNDMLATEGAQDSQVDAPAMELSKEQSTIEDEVNENNDLPSADENSENIHDESVLTKDVPTIESLPEDVRKIGSPELAVEAGVPTAEGEMSTDEDALLNEKIDENSLIEEKNDVDSLLNDDTLLENITGNVYSVENAESLDESSEGEKQMDANPLLNADVRLDVDVQCENSNLSGLDDLTESDCNLKFIDELVDEVAETLLPNSTELLPVIDTNLQNVMQTVPLDVMSVNDNELETNGNLQTTPMVDNTEHNVILNNSNSLTEIETENSNSIGTFATGPSTSDSIVGSEHLFEELTENSDVDGNALGLADLPRIDYNALLPPVLQESAESGNPSQNDVDTEKSTLE